MLITAETATGRQLHYGEFYQLRPVDTAPGPLPRVAVVGNCQAESLRILLESSGAVRSFRIPPVHEWTASDLPFVHAAVQHTDVLITQPVRADYRGLPIGSAQLRSLLSAAARVVFYPVLRFDALNPYLAIIRSPEDPGRNPPVVPYHDLRILARAAGLRDRGRTSPHVWSDIVEDAAAQLRLREERFDAVPMSDVLRTIPVWHTLNHPDNATLTELARRVLSTLGLTAQPRPPRDREMLGHLRAPIHPEAAAGLGCAVGRPQWTESGAAIDQATIDAAQLEFYRAHPEVVLAGLERHARRLEQLGLLP